MALFITRSTRSVDITGPTAPTITATPASTSTVTIQRTVAATDASGVSSYETQRSPAGVGSWTTFDTSATNPITAAGLSSGTAYDFRQRGVDTLGNAGAFSNIVTATPAASSEWADVYITNTNQIGAHMAVAGRKVGVKVGSTFTGLLQNTTPGNGATMDIVVGGSFDGAENAVRIYPPTARINGGDAEYAGWLMGMQLWNNGANDIAQANMRVLMFYGTRYFDLAPPAKCFGFQNSTVLGPGGDENNRVGVYDNYASNWSNYRYPLVIAGGGVGYYNPPVPGWYWVDSGPDTTKMMQIGGTSNHALTPPRTNGEWVCFEQMLDLRRNRGNPNGIHRLVARWRDGTTRSLVYELNWDSGWDFNARYVAFFEGLGFYWNTAGTANANNYIMHSHATFAANMGVNEMIGPPPGFLL